MSGQGGPGAPNKISENIGGEIKVVANDLQTTAINNAVTTQHSLAYRSPGAPRDSLKPVGVTWLQSPRPPTLRPS